MSQAYMKQHKGIAHRLYPSIYLAGKISSHDWRMSIVGEELAELHMEGHDEFSSYSWGLPILRGKCYGMDYVGPFYVHGRDRTAHRCNPDLYYTPDWDSRKAVVQHCFTAIRDAELVFAWLANGFEAYGTIAELGYAKGIGKTIWIATPHLEDDLWFVESLADKIVFDVPTAKAGLERLLRIESHARDMHKLVARGVKA